MKKYNNISTPMNAILKDILQTKRPTNDAKWCHAYTTGVLDTLGIAYLSDIHNNITVDLGGTTCFTAHTDTVDNKQGNNLLQTKDNIVTVMGGGVLGADCGSGMYVLIRMILASKPGLYVFFSTEEQGRVGSTQYAMPEHIQKCVSFDRKGTDNLITHQMGERGCSEAFADAFIAAFDLPYKKDPTGSFTDSYSFFDKVPECINLSVGYYNQHTKQESQDIAFLEKLVDACIALDWEALPVERDPTTTDYDFGDDRWDWYKTPYTKSANNYSNRYTFEPTTIEDFVYEYPYVVSDLLEEYGLTLQDLQKHKRLIDNYALGTGNDEEAA